MSITPEDLLLLTIKYGRIDCNDRIWLNTLPMEFLEAYKYAYSIGRNEYWHDIVIAEKVEEDIFLTQLLEYERRN